METPVKIPHDVFAKVEMRVGAIRSAEKVPDADRLLRLIVDLGEAEPRQIVSGIAEYFPEPQELVGKHCIFVSNLEPRTIRGLTSDGMIVAATAADGTFTLVVPEKEVAPGTKLR